MYFGADIKQIYCRKSHTLILTKNNDLFISGENIFRQFKSDSDIEKINIFQKTSIDLFTRSNNKDEQIESDYYNSLQNFKFPIKDKIKEISYGEYHTFILMKNDNLFALGNNGYGQLGLGYNTDTKNCYKLCYFVINCYSF